MAMPALSDSLDRRARLSDPRLRREVEAAVRRRIRGDDAEDVVQAAFTDVLSAADVPEPAEEFRRFVFGVARNKVFDHFRRRQREVPEDQAPELADTEPPLSARDILRWAEGELPDSGARDTFEWMLREGDGEKLEQIARDAKVPAPRVRQRVSRLRRFLRQRWAAELMLLSSLGIVLLVGVGIYLLLRRPNPDDVARREPPRGVPSTHELTPPVPSSIEPNRPASKDIDEPRVAPSVPSGNAVPKTPSKAKPRSVVPRIPSKSAPSSKSNSKLSAPSKLELRE